MPLRCQECRKFIATAKSEEHLIQFPDHTLKPTGKQNGHENGNTQDVKTLQNVRPGYSIGKIQTPQSNQDYYKQTPRERVAKMLGISEEALNERFNRLG